VVDPNDDPIELHPSRYENWRTRFAAERDRFRRVARDGSLADDNDDLVEYSTGKSEFLDRVLCEARSDEHDDFEFDFTRPDPDPS